MGKRHLVTAVALAAAMTTAALPASASAAATPPALSDFVLEPTNGNLQGIVDQLDAELPKLGVQNILEQANRTDAPKGADCTSPALDTMKWPLTRKFCFNAGDNATTEWMPQGITTVADAQEDQQWGTKQAILVSWYDKQTDPVKGARVSFLDPATGNYQHVLLAYPYTNTYGNPSYEALTTPQAGDGSAVHAGGIAWYGNYLYLADTRRGIRVFDMRYIFDIKSATNGDVTDGKQMGRQSGKYYSYGYRYVMPQVAGYSNPGGLADFPAEHKCNPSGPQKFSYLALDRSPTPDALVTGEYCAKQDDPNTYGRVAEWPMDGNTGKPKLDADGKWRATAAHRLPKPRVQGAVSTVGRWYLSSTGNGDTGPGYLQAAKGIGVLTTDSTEQEVAIGVEDLSFWPGKNELWTVTEHPDKRIIYSTPRP
ncbi:hypothetical protein SAMN05421805_10351 [Saccharopolyspora antimicrobica]|uniref:Secreted protein n=1 Tax=Saccharopolyspora antimicrobica TaxID=455193 RepID=A0A1I4WTE9_9PSEU|nr:hypothetical protein [Saccharopolyspora antimicrobica]RKT82974.1 hypothetical protein ATL45_1239 [Saccharopolyspora antimicrobica]SFN16747.1 hypothetical protein SAMN05421805_10351 [Saccharopolyspora antimicrobica]